MIKINNWAVVAVNPSALYVPPEQYVRCLKGTVTGHPNFDDGTNLTTSAIANVVGRNVYTESGSHYVLGNVDPEYLEYCKDNNLHIPEGDNPILVK